MSPCTKKCPQGVPMFKKMFPCIKSVPKVDTLFFLFGILTYWGRVAIFRNGEFPFWIDDIIVALTS